MLTPEDEAMLRKIESGEIAFQPHPVKPGRRFAVQWYPNWIGPESRLVLMRVYWNRGTPGMGGCSHKVSVSLCWRPREAWVGVQVKPELWGFIAYLAILPCVHVRLHLKRAYGGSFI